MKISDIWLRKSWQDYRTPAFQVEGLGFELQLDHQAGSIKPNKMMLAAILVLGSVSQSGNMKLLGFTLDILNSSLFHKKIQGNL